MERTAFIGNLCFPKERAICILWLTVQLVAVLWGTTFLYYLNINYLRLVYLDGG